LETVHSGVNVQVFPPFTIPFFPSLLILLFSPFSPHFPFFPTLLIPPFFPSSCLPSFISNSFFLNKSFFLLSQHLPLFPSSFTFHPHVSLFLLHSSLFTSFSPSFPLFHHLFSAQVQAGFSPNLLKHPPITPTFSLSRHVSPSCNLYHFLLFSWRL